MGGGGTTGGGGTSPVPLFLLPNNPPKNPPTPPLLSWAGGFSGSLAGIGGEVLGTLILGRGEVSPVVVPAGAPCLALNLLITSLGVSEPEIIIPFSLAMFSSLLLIKAGTPPP